jgi:hypothetical protein
LSQWHHILEKVIEGEVSDLESLLPFARGQCVTRAHVDGATSTRNDRTTDCLLQDQERMNHAAMGSRSSLTLEIYRVRWSTDNHFALTCVLRLVDMLKNFAISRAWSRMIFRKTVVRRLEITKATL